MTSPTVHVAAAAIVNGDNEVLISRRQDGTHLAGFWEFPGGKLEPGESVTSALRRELEEELAITPRAFRPLIKVRHDYPEKSVLLDVWRVTAFSGEPRPLEGQSVRWQPIAALDPCEFPAADVPVIAALRLSDRLLITGAFSGPDDFSRRLARALENGAGQVQLRLKPGWFSGRSPREALDCVERASALCALHGAGLVLNMPLDVLPAALDAAGPDAGIHLDSARLAVTASRPPARLLSASCHTAAELEKAHGLGVDYALLSPVCATRSHPDAEPLGWARFAEMVEYAVVPVYALGGVGADDITSAWDAGAQGVAAISAFWD